MGAIPVLQSSRLTLRSIRAEDHPQLLAMSHDAEVTQYLNEGEPPSAGQVWQRMAMALGQWALRGYGMMALDDADGMVGRVGIYHPFDEPDPQLSYIIARRGWGKGYATESASLVLDWMMASHKPDRLISHIHPNNTGSARVAMKLGGVREREITSSSATMDLWVYPPAGR